jgi:transcription elongation GreA/GreB family factor
MSRAFMKELEDAPEPKVISAPRESPITPAGMRALEKRLGIETDEARRKELRDQIDRAVVVEPPLDRKIVGFGARVTVKHEDGKRQTFTIVGEAELDVANGKITDASPLGSALLGHRAGQRVVWKRPVGDVALTIESIAYD